MNKNKEDNSLAGRLLWPEHTPVSETERKLAAAQITRTQQIGTLTDDQAQQRHNQVVMAQTRAELQTALAGLPGMPSATLLTVRRVVTLLWLGISLLQVIIWTLISLIGQQLTTPWWLWTVLIGGLVVGGLWWFSHSAYRIHGVVAQKDKP